jgi:Domain of unknown function (DUF4184)
MGSWRARATQIPDCLGHNGGVPFTLAHGAAALPFRRLHLVFSGLLVGTFAPDFEYFLRLSPDDGFGHTLLGTFVLTLPLALLAPLSNFCIIGFGWTTNDSNPIQYPALSNTEGQQWQI